MRCIDTTTRRASNTAAIAVRETQQCPMLGHLRGRKPREQRAWPPAAHPESKTSPRGTQKKAKDVGVPHRGKANAGRSSAEAVSDHSGAAGGKGRAHFHLSP